MINLNNLLFGDKRSLIYPVGDSVGEPIAIDAHTARRLVDKFIRTGLSIHSRNGRTLWLILGYCEVTHTPYRLTSYPDVGYKVENITAEEIDNEIFRTF